MNCGRSVGTDEYPARPKISAMHTAATTAAEGAAGVEVAKLIVDLFCAWDAWTRKTSGFRNFARAQCQHGKGQSEHRF